MSKESLDELFQDGNVNSNPGEEDQMYINLIKQGKTNEAIELFQTNTGCSLKDAKIYIKNLASQVAPDEADDEWAEKLGTWMGEHIWYVAIGVFVIIGLCGGWDKDENTDAQEQAQTEQVESQAASEEETVHPLSEPQNNAPSKEQLKSRYAALEPEAEQLLRAIVGTINLNTERGVTMLTANDEQALKDTKNRYVGMRQEMVNIANQLGDKSAAQEQQHYIDAIENTFAELGLQ